MRLSNNNLFTSKVFVADVCNDIEVFSYEGDPEVPRVIVSMWPEVRTHNFGDHCPIKPFPWQNEEQFDALCIKALLKSCEISKNIETSIAAAQYMFHKRELDIHRILISKNTTLDVEGFKQIFEIVGASDKWYWWVHKVDGLADNEIMFLAPPDFLGVVAIKTDVNSETVYDEEYEHKYGKGAKDELYALAIMNTNAAVLVKGIQE